MSVRLTDGRLRPNLLAMTGSPQTASAGILLYRMTPKGLQVLVAHPGGPFWARRHQGAWSLPKGLIEDGEDAESAAKREFEEETGHRVTGELLDLGEVRQRSHKLVRGFAARGDLDPAALVSNTFPMEWPPRSGKIIQVPEIDQVAWCAPAEAKTRLNEAQRAFVDRLVAHLGEAGATSR